MIHKLIEDLRHVGSTQAGALMTEDGTVWHPANLLLIAADELERLSKYYEVTKSLADEVYRHRSAADQLYADLYMLSQVYEALTGKQFTKLAGMELWEEMRR